MWALTRRCRAMVLIEDKGGGRTRRSVPLGPDIREANAIRPYPATDGRDETKPLRECLAGISTARGASPQKRRGTGAKKTRGLPHLCGDSPLQSEEKLIAPPVQEPKSGLRRCVAPIETLSLAFLT